MPHTRLYLRFKLLALECSEGLCLVRVNDKGQGCQASWQFLILRVTIVINKSHLQKVLSSAARTQSGCVWGVGHRDWVLEFILLRNRSILFFLGSPLGKDPISCTLSNINWPWQWNNLQLLLLPLGKSFKYKFRNDLGALGSLGSRS